MKQSDLKAKPKEAGSTKNLVSNTSRGASPGAASIEMVDSRPNNLEKSKNVFPSPAARLSNSNAKKNIKPESQQEEFTKPLTTPASTSPTSKNDIKLLFEREGRQRDNQMAKGANTIKSSGSSTSLNFSSFNSSKKSDFTLIEDNRNLKELTLPVCQENFHKISKVLTDEKVKLGMNYQPTNNTEIEFGKSTLDPGTKNTPSLIPSENCSEKASNLFSCTISITNNQITNNNNHNLLSNFHSSASSSLSSSTSNYESAPQSPENHKIFDYDDADDNLNPLSLIANAKDKIVINVPLETSYETNCSQDHIYEELDHRESIYYESQNNLDEMVPKSIFEGASKDQILGYLEDAKERVEILVEAEPELVDTIDVIEVGVEDEVPILHTKLTETITSNRRNRTSNVSNSSTDSSATTSSSIDIDDELMTMKTCTITSSIFNGQLVERNDSGVGIETKNKPLRLKKGISFDEVEHQCADCDNNVEPGEDDVTGLLHYPLFCHRCDKKRSERKEIISEIVDTEFKYGRDLRIIREEFYRPIEIAGLLSKEQLKGVFLNLDELICVNSKFSEKLQDAIDIATEQGDEVCSNVDFYY